MGLFSLFSVRALRSTADRASKVRGKPLVNVLPPHEVG